jgi:hypothetical protein
MAREREQAEARSAKELNDRVVSERKSEQLSLEKAEAESRATATLQARIAAEEALEAQAARSAEASARAAAMREERRALKARLRSRRLPLIGAGLVVVAAAVAAAVTLYPRTAEEQAPAGEPLRLQLDYRLTSART